MRARRIAAAALVIPLSLAVLAACDDDGDASKAAAKTACTATQTATPTAAVTVPGLTLSGVNLGSSATSGSTTTYTGFASGTDPATERDAINTQLTAGGLTLGGQDGEKGVEAESDFKGAVTGHVTVRNLCTGYLSVMIAVSK